MLLFTRLALTVLKAQNVQIKTIKDFVHCALHFKASRGSRHHEGRRGPTLSLGVAD